MLETAELSPRVEKAFLVGIEEDPEENAEALLDELEELVGNLNIGIGGRTLVRMREPNPRFLLGKGKVESILQQASFNGCDCIVFDRELTPAQQRNWEEESKVCVIDRHEVILDIFADRAQTKEAVLQVQLAQLEYSLPRLRGGWTHLSRQRGGGVTQRGEGEKQIQLDRRMVRDRIARVKRELEEVKQHRQVQRKKRMEVPMPGAAIVGYTNAGKSSLLNRLTGADLLAADKLFATLDPTTRRAELPSGQVLLLTDTVGFVRRLPHRLVDAFKATLEEALVSNFLLHVVDVASPDAADHFKVTRDVLKELGAGDRPTITVFNKVDAVADEAQLTLARSLAPDGIFISARTGEGIEALQAKLDEMLLSVAKPLRLLIPHSRYDLVHKLHEIGAVQNEKATDAGFLIDGYIPTRWQEPLREYTLPA